MQNWKGTFLAFLCPRTAYSIMHPPAPVHILPADIASARDVVA